MPADVRDLDALREWRAALLTYAHDAGEAVSGIRLELRRGQEWVSRQLDLWQRAVRDAEEEVVRAKAELSARKMPGFDGRMPDTTVQEKNLRRALARLDFCEEQVVKCRKWMVQLPKLVDETFTGPSHRLIGFLDTDVPAAAAALQRQIEALERYAEARPDYAPVASNPPVSRDPAGSGPNASGGKTP